MASYSRQLLSGSVNGKPVKVAATATPGTTLHTAVAGTAAYDEVYVWLTNTGAAAVAVTVEFGSAADPDGLIVKGLSLPANSPPIPVLTGQVLQNGLTVGVFASAANVVVASGYVNRIS